MIDFSNLSLPFNVQELLTSSTSLIRLIGPFVLLGLSFIAIRYIINLIFVAVYGNKYEINEDEYSRKYGS